MTRRVSGALKSCFSNCYILGPT